MDIENCEGAVWVSIQNIHLRLRPIQVNTVYQRNIFAHLLAHQRSTALLDQYLNSLLHSGVSFRGDSRVAAVFAFLGPVLRVDGPSVFWESEFRRIVERRKVQYHEISTAVIVERVKLVVHAVEIVQDCQIQAIVGEEAGWTEVVGTDPYSTT